MTSTISRLLAGTGVMAATAACLVGLGPAKADAAPARLVGTVGPGHTITLRTASGARLRSVKAGTYTIVVRDRADDHDFRLAGPGLNKATGVSWMGSVTWRVRLVRGKTYRFVCDPHSDEMRGSFRVR